MLKTIVLAAGRGRRLKSALPKVLHKIFDKPILSWVLDGLAEIPQEDIIVVCGYRKEMIKSFLHAYPVTTVDQDEQMGTGHALMCAASELEEFDGSILIVNGDCPLLTPQTLNDFYNHHYETGSQVTILSSQLNDPTGYGRLVKRNGSLIGIKEDKDCTEIEKSITEVNAGAYLFEWQAIRDGLNTLSSNNAQEEYYLTDLIAWAYQQGLKIDSFALTDPEEALGVNQREDIMKATKVLNRRSLDNLMNNGVTVMSPETTFISPDVDISYDTVIMPNTYIQRRVNIGSNCTIGPNTTIFGPAEIGNESTIINSHISRSSIGDKASIGPYAHIRFGSDIANSTRVGSFVEVKNTYIGDGTSAAHLSYIGDAKIKNNVNIGAGTITANYNAFTGEKSGTVIESGASTGANSVLIAPINMGEGSSVAAGSVVNNDIPSSSLAIARPRQEIKRLPDRRSQDIEHSEPPRN